MARVGSAAVLLALSATAATAWSQEITVEAASSAFAAARFEQARNITRALIDSDRVSRRDLARAHALASALAILFGQEEQARASAEAAIALDPTVAAPEGSPEAVGPLFAVMRERRSERSLRLTVGFSARDGTARSIRAHAELEEAPSSLAGSVELRCRVGSGSESLARSQGARTDLVVAIGRAQSGERLVCLAAARSPGGAVLLETRAETALDDDSIAAADASVGGAQQGSRGGGGVSVRTWTWIGLGAVTLATIVGVALVVGSSSGGDVTIGSPQVQGF